MQIRNQKSNHGITRPRLAGRRRMSSRKTRNDMSRLENIINYQKFCHQGIVILKLTSFVIDFNPCHSVNMLVN